MYGNNILFLIVIITTVIILNGQSGCCEEKKDGSDPKKKESGKLSLFSWAKRSPKTFWEGFNAFAPPAWMTSYLPVVQWPYWGIKTEKKYSNDTFRITVEFDASSFTIETNHNQSIFEIKKKIHQKINYIFNPQTLVLLSNNDHKTLIILDNETKLGDYMNSTCECNDICSQRPDFTSCWMQNSVLFTCDQWKLIVTKRLIKTDMIFTSKPNVTHYEYAMMSLHVYEPNKPFLHDWYVTDHNPPHKNGLAFAIYMNTKRHQLVVSLRGTIVTTNSSSILDNILTDIRLFLSDQNIDTFDAARLSLFDDESIIIPHLDSLTYSVSFTGHSLGAALAECLACHYQAYAITFDSPGTSRILNNDPICQRNIKKDGYEPEKKIRTYLGNYANVINAANPQFGDVMYLKQFGIHHDTSPNEFYYIHSSAESIFLAACLFMNTAKKHIFKLGLWFSIICFIMKSSSISYIGNSWNLNGKIFNSLIQSSAKLSLIGEKLSRILTILSFIPANLPLIFTILLLFHSISTLADIIERLMCGLSVRLRQFYRSPSRIQYILDNTGIVLREFYQSLPNEIQDKLDIIGIPLMRQFHRFSSIIKLILVKFGSFLKQLFHQFSSIIKPIVDKFRSFLKQLFHRFSSVIKPILDKFGSFLKQLFHQFSSIIKPILDKFGSFLKQQFHRFLSIIKPILDSIGISLRQYIDLNSVFCRLVPLWLVIIISFSTIVILPLHCYIRWLKLAHSIDKFVNSFNSTTGKAYKAEHIEASRWPTFIDHSIKLVTFRLMWRVPKCIRLNFVLYLFVR
ncbi:unnamed protein product [Adineta steineri]|uniref:Fungal lipase-like domain-containing protein n=1 Tax=Adineta steineri TaxID=433720 RepID=A0A814YFB7_9BILA|nr:unnamed protein product [Adineta steineri]